MIVALDELVSTIIETCLNGSFGSDKYPIIKK
jgi:hypothetical protein